MHGAEYKSYEEFGAYHAAQLATQKKKNDDPMREFAIAFIGGAILTWAILAGGGLI